MSEIETLTFNGNNFELRTSVENNRYCVRAFLNDQLVSPTYSIDFETHTDYFTQCQESAVNALKDIAKSDIEQKLYIK